MNLRSAGNCFQFALDSSEQFLHVVTQQSSPTQGVSANALNVFKVEHNGTLTEVPTSPTLFLPVPNLVRPQGRGIVTSTRGYSASATGSRHVLCFVLMWNHRHRSLQTPRPPRAGHARISKRLVSTSPAVCD